MFKWGRLHLRAFEDDDEEDWWFASTAIPLVAATIGPLANVLSIAALVVSWRADRLAGNDGCSRYDGNLTLLPELESISYADPNWCYRLNVVSLVVGFVGNFFLLANFTGRIRYIIALPATIILWYIATGILTAITVAMHLYAPPKAPCQTYTQGFWCAVIAAVLYFACSMMLMVNMLGYFLGHYPQRFNLTGAQRTLILQTMMFFLWLAAGAGIFSRVERDVGGQDWLFTDALYFCDVTILTVGFGDLVPADDVGRGLVFPYSVVGIIMLGLMVGSLTSFVGDLSKENVVKKHMNSRRRRIFERSDSLHQQLNEAVRPRNFQEHPEISQPINGRRITANLAEKPDIDLPRRSNSRQTTNLPDSPTLSEALIADSQSHGPSRYNTIRINAPPKPPHISTHKHNRRRARTFRLHLLHREKDRFDAMRRIQRNAARFKGYTALASSILAFCTLWLAGAAVFHATEAQTLGMTYFQALYFCYVSLLTIGYGDLAPKSNAGRPFFVVWSLLAVPTMTILVSHLGATLIASFAKATSLVADFTVLPKYGAWRSFLDSHPRLLGMLQSRHDRRERAARIEAGFPGPEPAAAADPDDGGVSAIAAPRSLNDLAGVDEHLTPRQREARLAKRLAAAIRRTAAEVAAPDADRRRYSYEEWVEFTELIRFTGRKRLRARHILPDRADDEEEEEEEGLIEWDWIGENSPMMAGKSEPGFVLERLCESLGRWVAAAERRIGHGHLDGEDPQSPVSPATPVHVRFGRRVDGVAHEDLVDGKREA